MATSNGTVKQVAVTEFNRPRANGIIAIDLEEGDHLISARLTTKTNEVLLIANSGKAIRFKCEEVRCMGRVAKGVRGIKLQKGQRVISLIVLQPEGAILLATKNGYGKRTGIDEFPTIGRGGQGVIGIQTSERNGEAIGAAQVFEGDELMLISDQGTLVRTRVDEISLVGRNTQGVRLINLSTDEHLVGIERVEEITGVAENFDSSEEE
jgi:DNA gyrase subunit A